MREKREARDHLVGSKRYRISAFWQVALVYGAVFVIYFPASNLLFEAWQYQSGYSHGWLVLGLSVWLVARKLGCSNAMFSERTPIWVVSLALASAIGWLLGYLSATQSVQLLALLGLLFVTANAAFGSPARARFLVPVGILIFALPVWDVVLPFLRELTILVTDYWLSVFGWTAFVIGDVVHVRAGSFLIEEGCSGLHFFVVGLLIAMLMAHLYQLNAGRSAMLLVFSAFMALLANWVRVFLIIVAGDLYGMQHFLIRVDHYFFGWLVFALAMIPVFLMGNRLQVSFVETELRQNQEGVFSWKILTATILILSIAPCVATVVTASQPTSVQSVLLPSAIGDWMRIVEDEFTNPPLPVFIEPGDEASATYRSTLGGKVSLYVNSYGRQSQGKELVGDQNSWFPEDWHLFHLENGEARSRSIIQRFSVDEVRRERESALVAHSYLVRRQFHTNVAIVKAQTAIGALTGDFVSHGFAAASYCHEDCEQARIQLQAFLRQLVEDVTWLPESDD
jgi:exosortase